MRSDVEFLGLTDDGSGRYTFTVENHLTRLDRRLYGGTAIAVSITTAELVTERPARWMTTQFVATAPPDEEISVVTEVLAPGRRTNQVRVTGSNEAGEVMFASLGATGHARATGVSGTFEAAPVVATPDESEPWLSPISGMARLAGVQIPSMPALELVGFTTIIEFRQPEILSHPDPGPGRLCLWARRKDRVPLTAATAAFIADMVPLSIAYGAGVMAGGMSLDNTIRIGAFEETEWVLVDLRPHLAAGDYGHGNAHLWSESGHLLGTASQTASMFAIDFSTFS